MNDKNPLRKVSDLTEKDLIVMELLDNRVFVGYLLGLDDRFLICYMPLQLQSVDTSDVNSAFFHPYFHGYTGTTRTFNISSVVSISASSHAMFVLYEEKVKSMIQREVLKTSGGTSTILKKMDMATYDFGVVENILNLADKRTKH